MASIDNQNTFNETYCTVKNTFGASNVSSETTAVYTAFGLLSQYYKVTLLTLLLVAIIYVIYKCYWSPIKIKKELTDIGFDHIKRGRDRAFNIQRALNAKRVGHKLPPPYPNGWFALVDSDDLKIGDVVPVDAIGLNLCVYRGEDGTARVVDAYCPHLGAHLGVGGSVSGNCIRCPFHHWTFGENGDCVGILGVDKVPKGISIKTWPTMEVDGAVWVWYDVEGRPPLWTVEPKEEVAGWGCRGSVEFVTSCHIMDISENGADSAHLDPVHAPVLSASIFKYPLIHKLIGQHNWCTEWSKGPADHIVLTKLKHSFLFLTIDVLPLDVSVEVIGAGHVRLLFKTPTGPLLLVQTTTPMGPLLQKVVQRVYSPFYNALSGIGLFYIVKFQFGRDICIWNSKRYASDPVYAAKSDRTIRAHRAWFAKLYSENSIPFKDAIQNPLD